MDFPSSYDNKRIAVIVSGGDLHSVLATQEDERTFLDEGNLIIVATDDAPVNLPEDYILSTGSIFSQSSRLNVALRSVDPYDYDFVILDGSIHPRLSTLREMKHVMYRIDRHAVVAPRMTQGVFCEFPELDTSLEEGAILDSLKSLLPPFARIPFPPTHCLMLRGETLALVHYLDEALFSLQGAIADFCLKISDFGYDTVLANHTFEEVTAPKAADLSDFSTLFDRYGYLEDYLAYYPIHGLDACDRFFSRLVPNPTRKPKILINCMAMFTFHCGTSEYQIALLEYFFELFADKYDIDVYVNHEAAEYHDLERRFTNIHYVGEDLGTYDIGILATQPINLDEQFFFNEHCLRIVYTMLDAIMMRCHYLTAPQGWFFEDIVRSGLEGCDGIIAISGFSRNDYKSYFIASEGIQQKPCRDIYISTDFGKHVDEDEVLAPLPFRKFNLISGNSLRHKAIRKTADVVANDGHNYIAVGADEEGYIYPNVYGYTSARLSETFLDSLYERCDLFIFPSQYEGFGLPITIALKHGKRVIISDNELNRELAEHFSELQEYFNYFRTFEDVPQLVNELSDLSPLPTDVYHHSWREAIVEVESFVSELLAMPADTGQLEHRWRTMNLLKSQTYAVSESIGLRIAFFRRFVKGHPGREKLWTTLGNAVYE